MQQSQHCFCSTYLSSSVILIYAAVLYLSMRNIILIYAAVLYLFTQQHYTYVRSSQLMQHLFKQHYGFTLYLAALLIAAALYLFMQQYYTYLHSSVILYLRNIILIYAAALLIQHYYTYLCINISTYARSNAYLCSSIIPIYTADAVVSAV